MKIMIACAALLSMLGCSESPAPTEPGQSGLFIGVDLSKLPESDRRVIVEASEDFRAVLAGQKPVHARFDEEHPLPADGGTTYYKGRRYKLTLVQSLSSFGDLEGVAYGPMIAFDPEFAGGNTSQLSAIRVYTSDSLRELLARGPRAGPK